MKDWKTVQPDKVCLLNKHFTPGRNAKIEFITRHHLAMVGTTEDVWRVWQTRQASAHYVVEPNGVIGQLVWDRDTAWANASPWANARTIAIEHSNSAGAGADWPINEVTIREGAKLAAALCVFYRLGRPVYGKNIRDHKEFTGTSCPYHLANGGRYHAQWMHIAQDFYDELTGAKQPQGKEPVMTDFDQITRRYRSRVEGSDVQMTPIDALLNADANAWNNGLALERIERRLDDMDQKINNLKGTK